MQRLFRNRNGCHRHSTHTPTILKNKRATFLARNVTILLIYLEQLRGKIFPYIQMSIGGIYAIKILFRVLFILTLNANNITIYITFINILL